ncbi:hypothetical protein ACOSP7_008511 [Xanthoceras sorbifolium]
MTQPPQSKTLIPNHLTSSPKQMCSCLCCHTGIEPLSFTELALLRQGRGWRFRTSLNELSSRKYLDRNVKEGPKVFPSRSILFHPRMVLHIRLFTLQFGLFRSRFNGYVTSEPVGVEVPEYGREAGYGYIPTTFCRRA